MSLSIDFFLSLSLFLLLSCASSGIKQGERSRHHPRTLLLGHRGTQGSAEQRAEDRDVADDNDNDADDDDDDADDATAATAAAAAAVGAGAASAAASAVEKATALAARSREARDDIVEE